MNIAAEIETRRKGHRKLSHLQRELVMRVVEDLQYEGSLAEEADRKLHTLVGIVDGIAEFIGKSEIHKSFFAEEGAVKDLSHAFTGLSLILSRVAPHLAIHLHLEAAE